MKDEIVVRVEKLGKCFKIYSNPWHRAREWVTPGRCTYHQPFGALKDISFEVRRGEFLGIIGQNGAGKSTLLKILSGVLQPTTGTYQINGKVLSMLELGMDFNPCLSGRENIVRTAELLGFPNGYVQERMEQIAGFSELGEFFDRPVRLYSKGMGSRLAFSLFVFLDCDVLILDEVLAVGDIFFKQKCYARLEELITKGTTILLVTHSMTVIRQFCDQVIVFEKGHKLYQGDPVEGIRMYSQIRGKKLADLVLAIPQDDANIQNPLTNDEFSWPADDIFTPAPSSENGQARFTKFAICNDKGEPCIDFMQGEQAYFYCEFQLKQNIGMPIVVIKVTNQFNILIHAKSSLHHEISMPQQGNQGDYIRFCRRITLNLAPGEYIFGLVLAAMPPGSCTCSDKFDTNDFPQKKIRLYRHDQVGFFRIMPRHGKWLRKLHGGICDLPGDCHIQLVSNT